MPLKIMVVDDEPASLKPIRPLAAPLGHIVLMFDNCREAGERLEKQRFDVIFVGMSQRDGLALVRQTRNSPSNRDATIVILSAPDDIENVQQAFGEGADFVLTKPVTANRLRSMLAAMDSAGWKGKRHKARLPLFTDVVCTWNEHQFPLRSMNISESGMLLQCSADIEVGQEVVLQFQISEVHAEMNVRARIVRKRGPDRVGVEFIGLAPEACNAIQLYAMGRLKDLTAPGDLAGVRMAGMNRFFSPGH
jgi:CheY-like chemotaxis protein